MDVGAMHAARTHRIGILATFGPNNLPRFKVRGSQAFGLHPASSRHSDESASSVSKVAVWKPCSRADSVREVLDVLLIS